MNLLGDEVLKSLSKYLDSFAGGNDGIRDSGSNEATRNLLNVGANDATFMRTPGFMNANNRHRNEEGISGNHSEVGGDKRLVFINHTVTTR